MQELEGLRQYDFHDFGIETEKYIANLEGIQHKELKAYGKVHYLITLDVNHNDKIAEHIKQLSMMEGIEVESTFD